MLSPVEEKCSNYDLLIGALGYEPRCMSVGQKISSITRALHYFDFDSMGVLSYDQNVERASEFGVIRHPVSALNFTEEITEIVRSNGYQTVAVDISSMTREILSSLLVALSGMTTDLSIKVDFYYSPPVFDARVERGFAVQSATIVHPAFSGLESDPEFSVVGIMGLGFEPNLALGIAEFLDLAKVFAYIPYGHDRDFDDATENANASLLLGDTPCVPYRYDMNRPGDLYARLLSLLQGMGPSNRIAIVPLGPKIFGLCAMLAAINCMESVAVWRFSLGQEIATPTETRGDPIVLATRSIS